MTWPFSPHFASASLAALLCTFSALAVRPGDVSAQAGPPPAKGITGRQTSLTFGRPEIVRPRSPSGQDLSDHYGLVVQVTMVYQPPGTFRGHPAPAVAKRFRLFTYNVAQVPSRLYEGSRSARDNMDDIAQHLRNEGYDIVCLQELFLPVLAAFEQLPRPDLRERFMRSIRDLYPFQVVGPSRSGVAWDSGLLILSRFPILERNVHEYSEGVGTPDNFVNKGILHARILIGTESYHTIDVFTSHTQSGNGTDEKVTRGGQFTEAKRFIDRHPGVVGWVLAGDLNVPGVLQTPNYDALALPQRERVYTEMQDQYSRMMASLGKPRDLWTEFYSVTCGRDETLPCDRGHTSSVQGNNFRGRAYSRGNRLDYILVENRRTGRGAR